ncbi:MAG TPA: TonB-dependent receptor [Rhizobacter sp.]|nr:TonB-dependent receptor [Rhizobacter sp.]
MTTFASVPSAPPAARSLLCLCLIAAFVATASAQSVLPPVVVTGSREPLPLDRVTSDVIVIDAERILTTTADSLETLLRIEAGVQVSRSGGPGQSAGIFIRGAGSSNTVVLVDGVRVGSATLGQFEFESISLSQIDRIEVLRGPGSSLYGADAVGGVVQIFTKRGEGPLRLFANVAAGGYHSRQGGAGISGGAGGFDYVVSLGRESSDGVSATKPNAPFGVYNPDLDGFTRDSGQVKLGFTPAAGHRIGLNLVETRLNGQYDSTEPPSFLPDADFRNKLTSSVASLDYRGVLSSAWTTTVQLSKNDDDSKTGGDIIDRFRTRRDQLTWQNAWTPNVDTQVMLAYEHLNEQAESPSYDQERRNDALVLGYSGKFGPQALQVDVRQDSNSVYGDNTTGRLGWSLEVAKGLRVRVLAGNTFRAPSFNELFFPGFGVPGIEPEKGRSFELGLNWREGDSNAALTVYRNRVSNLIAYDSSPANCPPDPSYMFGCAVNVGHARLQGATLSGSQRWKALEVGATVDLVDATNEDTGQRLNRRAAHQASLTADYRIGDWSVGGSLVGVGSRPDGTQMLGSYETLDLRGSWRFARQWRLEAKLLNATDRDYEPAYGYQSLGRQAWIGLRFDGAGL